MLCFCFLVCMPFSKFMCKTCFMIFNLICYIDKHNTVKFGGNEGNIRKMLKSKSV